MKVLCKDESLCIGCHECEEACSNAFFKEENINKASLRVNEKESIEIITCTQCGDCIDICPVEAIYKDNKGIVKINKNLCVGCFMCVGFCDESAMFQHDDYIEPFKCISCSVCEKQCPTGAIFIEDK